MMFRRKQKQITSYCSALAVHTVTRPGRNFLNVLLPLKMSLLGSGIPSLRILANDSGPERIHN